jgi:hypothetical protein
LQWKLRLEDSGLPRIPVIGRPVARTDRVVLHLLYGHIDFGDIGNAVQVPEWQRISNFFTLAE